MNYRHIYHAGVFADLIKHITLIAILEQLSCKDKPYAVLDAFAGTGIYDLNSEQALKTDESTSGIKKLLAYAETNVIGEISLLQKYLKIIEQVGGPNMYPGSPLVIHKYLRLSDRLIASELHPEDFRTLKKFFSFKPIKPAVAVHHLDAYNAIKAFLPFPEKRGLVFIDPPFEVKDEFEKIINALQIISKRAANIITMIWYPVKDELQIKKFYQNFKSLNFKETLKIEFTLKKGSKNLEKCGLLIVNPPDIKQALEQTFQYLASKVYQGQAYFDIQILKNT